MKLSLSNIRKSFGETRVLKGISLDVPAGRAFGLLGKNGAGKTTLLRIVMGVFLPDEGEVLVDGKKIARLNARLGYLPEERGMYGKKKISEQLIYFGRLKGMTAKDAERAAKEYVERFELGDYYDKKLSVLSKGNQQKIQLAAALINDPEIIILDEPFSGLDPVNARLLKNVVIEQAAAGKIVLFSSHQMGYIEEFCDEIAILNGGQIVLSGALSELKRRGDRGRVCIGGADAKKTAFEVGKLLKESTDIAVRQVHATKEGCMVTLADPGDKDQLLQKLVAGGVSIEKFYIPDLSLEEIFIERAGA